MPWYQYNSRYRRSRERLIAANGGLVYSTYFDVARRYLFRPHDAHRAPDGPHPSQRHRRLIHAVLRRADRTPPLRGAVHSSSVSKIACRRRGETIQHQQIAQGTEPALRLVA